MTKPVRVLVGDPLPLFRDAVARTIRQDRELALVSEVSDGQSVLRDIEALQPDVAIVGIPLGDFAAERLVDAVARDALPTRIVFLLMDTDAETAFGALARGAAACLTRAVDFAGLRAAVGAAARGEIVVASELQTGLAREIRRHNPDRRPALSNRERLILRHIADGRSTQEIATAIRIGDSTVKTHVANACEKLGATTRAAAVAAAMRLGLLD